MASKRTQQPTPKAVLKSPASTTNPGVGRPHVCKKCNQQFLSENAMKKHRDAPSHDTMFSCETCNRKFGSRHAVGQHEESQPHTKKLAQMMAQMMAQTNAATASGAQEKGKGPATIPNPSKPHVCGKCNKPFSTLAAMEQHRASHDTAVPSRKKKSSSGNKPHTPALPSRSTKGHVYSESTVDYGFYDGDEIASWDDYCEASSARTGLGYSRHYSEIVWDEEQDWILCDKDCGWCGHCGDNVDF